MTRYTFVSEPAFAVGEDLVAAWNALCERVPDARFYHRPGWFAAVDRFRPEARTRVHAAFAGRELVGVVPLGRGRPHEPEGPDGLREAPAQDPAHFTDGVVAPAHRSPAFVDALLDHVRRVEGPCDLLRFPRMPDDGTLLAAVGGDGVPHVRRRASGSRVVDVTEPGRLHALSARQRRNVDRLARRAERELGSLTLRTWRGARGIDAGLDVFAEVEASGWKGDWRHLSALAYRTRERAFYGEVLRELAPRGEARIDAVYAGGRALAAHLALGGGDTWYLMKIGYDEQYRRLGPGGLLLHRFLEAMAADRTVRRVNLVTAPTWSDRWHLGEAASCDLWIRGSAQPPRRRSISRRRAPRAALASRSSASPSPADDRWSASDRIVGNR